MAGRKITGEQEARRCLAAASRAQGGLAAWARAHGIDGRSLNAWRTNLRRGSVPRPRAAPQLVELVLAGPRTSAARYVVRVGDVGLELGDDFRDETLRRLVGLLRAC